MAEDSEIIRDSLPLLSAWYAAGARELPWREGRSPYRVWIAEIMLQQTRIEAVIPYYGRFLEAYPTVEALAEAEEGRLLKLWEGLGYYSRARNLKRAAQILTEQYGGQLPKEVRDLKKLPGIGAYTAGAIASIAYGEPEPAVDGNVLRVLARLLASGRDAADAGTKDWAAGLLREHYPVGAEAALVTEGLMELGERLCLPKGVPQCLACPLQGLCRACAAGTMERYPIKTPPRKRRREERTVFLLCCRGKYALCRRPSKGLLAGLWEFPGIPGRLDAGEVRQHLASRGLEAFSLRFLGEAEHVFTHIEWQMSVWTVECAAESEGFVWFTPEEIYRELSVPSAFRFCLEAIHRERENH